MIMRAIITVTTKRLDCMPSVKATEAVMEATRAEWLEGMPPVRQIRLSRVSFGRIRFERRSRIIVFTSWARNQLVTEDKKMGFSNRIRNASDGLFRAGDITTG
jgi:hypothetical protein